MGSCTQFSVVKKKDEPVGIRVTCPFSQSCESLPITFDLVIKSWNSHNFFQATAITTPTGYISISSLSRHIEAPDDVGLNSGPRILRFCNRGLQCNLFPKAESSGRFGRPAQRINADRR